ncbi:MAG: class I SAM-dependent methyltransferase [Armatimonadota bacterium]
MIIRRYLAGHKLCKLQIGSGGLLYDGWLTTDLCTWKPGAVYLDATHPFPFADASFDYVAAEHLIEHLSIDDAEYMLRECYRILKPGGRIRLATPSFEKLFGLYNSAEADAQSTYKDFIVKSALTRNKINSECFVINTVFRWWGHQFIYDRPTMQTLLEQVGYRDVGFYSPGESDDEHLKGIEQHGTTVGDEISGFETMVVEARRA